MWPRRAIRELLATGLDPFTRFITPEDFLAMRKYDVTGVGLNLAPAEEYERKVGAPLPSGSPAEVRRHHLRGWGFRVGLVRLFPHALCWESEFCLTSTGYCLTACGSLSASGHQEGVWLFGLICGVNLRHGVKQKLPRNNNSANERRRACRAACG